MKSIYRIERQTYAQLWPSQGALYGEGRWNRKGFWVIYCSESVALAKLETLANSKSLPSSRVLLEIEVDDKAPIKRIVPADLPDNWMQVPYPKELHVLTERWLQDQQYVGLQIPSRQSPQEDNYLLYPLHPQFSQWVRVLHRTPIEFDQRLK
uniref:RES family NAD+ phosphorylase n=1 Tax=Roseihalotalea indica TaxID=2867963 RepID=A0AA49GI05_9BACT|nr:RES family NAD+ phosphorylase [Tunicatimonas sp. TK19036]